MTVQEILDDLSSKRFSDPKSLVMNQFLLLKEIGRGEYGIVYSAKENEEYWIVAVKKSTGKENGLYAVEAGALCRTGHMKYFPTFIRCETFNEQDYLAGATPTVPSLQLSAQEILEDLRSKRIPDPKPLVMNQFLPLRKIGKGDYGIVYSANDKDEYWIVAIKKNIGIGNGHAVETTVLGRTGHMKYFPTLILCGKGKFKERACIAMSMERAAVVLLDFEHAEFYERQGFQLPSPHFLVVVQAPPQILRGGEYTEMADWFLVAITSLTLAGRYHTPKERAPTVPPLQMPIQAILDDLGSKRVKDAKSLVINQFLLLRVIGRGEFGIVYSANDKDELFISAVKKSTGNESGPYGGIGHMKYFPTLIRCGKFKERAYIALSMEGAGIAIVLLDFGHVEFFNRKGLQLHSPNFFVVVQAPSQILRGGLYTKMADLFLVAITVLSLAGYSKLHVLTSRYNTPKEKALRVPPLLQMSAQEVLDGLKSKRVPDAKSMVKNQFLLLRVIGRGEFGIVYSAKDKDEHRIVAVKKSTGNENGLHAVETGSLRRIGHLKYYPTLIECGMFRGRAYIALSMEGAGIVIVLLDFGYDEFFNKKSFQVSSPNFFVVVQASPQIPRGGVCITMADWFLLAITVLTFAGYEKLHLPTSRYDTPQERADLHDARVSHVLRDTKKFDEIGEIRNWTIKNLQSEQILGQPHLENPTDSGRALGNSQRYNTRQNVQPEDDDIPALPVFRSTGNILDDALMGLLMQQENVEHPYIDMSVSGSIKIVHTKWHHLVKLITGFRTFTWSFNSRDEFHDGSYIMDDYTYLSPTDIGGYIYEFNERVNLYGRIFPAFISNRSNTRILICQESERESVCHQFLSLVLSTFPNMKVRKVHISSAGLSRFGIFFQSYVSNNPTIDSVDFGDFPHVVSPVYTTAKTEDLNLVLSNTPKNCRLYVKVINETGYNYDHVFTQDFLTIEGTFVVYDNYMEYQGKELELRHDGDGYISFIHFVQNWLRSSNHKLTKLVITDRLSSSLMERSQWSEKSEQLVREIAPSQHRLWRNCPMREHLLNLQQRDPEWFDGAKFNDILHSDGRTATIGVKGHELIFLVSFHPTE